MHFSRVKEPDSEFTGIVRGPPNRKEPADVLSLSLSALSTATMMVALSAPVALVAKAHADPTRPFYGDPANSIQKTEIEAWGTEFVQVLDSGTPTTWAFTDEIWDSHLFNPLRSHRWTLESLGEIPADFIDLVALSLPVADLPMHWQKPALAMRDAIAEGKIRTDLVQNPQGSQQHLLEILNASTVGIDGLAWELINGELVSQNLPPKTIEAIVGTATAAHGPLSPSSSAVVVMLSAYMHEIIEDAPGVSTARAYLTGEQDKSKNVTEGVEMLVGLAVDEPFKVQLLKAHFGSHGELPFVHLQLIDGFYLVDAVNGNIVGPYERNSIIDPKSLLAVHSSSYRPNTGVIVVDEYGKRVSVDRPISGDFRPDLTPDGFPPPRPGDPSNDWKEVTNPAPKPNFDQELEVDLPNRIGPKTLKKWWRKAKQQGDLANPLEAFLTNARCFYTRRKTYTKPQPPGPAGPMPLWTIEVITYCRSEIPCDERSLSAESGYRAIENHLGPSTKCITSVIVK